MPYDPNMESQYQAFRNSLLNSGMPSHAKQFVLGKFDAQYAQRQNQLNPNDYFNPGLINQYFDVGARNLNRGMGNAANTAQSQAGALAASFGRVNPMASILGAGTQARSPYVGALGQLEGQRAGALQGNQSQLYNALLQLMQGNRQFGLQQQQLGQNEAGTFDYLAALLPILGMATGGGSSILGSLLFGGNAQGSFNNPVRINQVPTFG